MPLLPGKENRAQNFHEFHQGKTYAHTKAKFGKKRADAQAVAVVLSNERKSSNPQFDSLKRKPRK